MWIPEWNVLVVDDEPDVLQVTKLIFKKMEVDGIPVKVHTAASKAEAIELLKTEFGEEGAPGTLAVAFIDVVMESDTAGLELCSFIRNDLHNFATQLYIRTGQPGTAPERSVIDNYNISGYFTKVEATEDKMYTLIKSGARQYYFTGISLVLLKILNAGIATSRSQDEMSNALSEGLQKIASRRGDKAKLAFFADDVPFVVAGYSQEEASATRERLSRLPMKSLSPMGESVALDPDSNQVLITIPAGPNNPPAAFLEDGYGVSDVFVQMMFTWITRSLAILWQQAGMREKI